MPAFAQDLCLCLGPILQVILKHCDAKKEESPKCTEQSPLTSFSLFMSPTRHLNSADSQSDSEEAKTNLVLPDDLPIDLRVKIVVCLIHLRNLHPIKVNFFSPLFPAMDQHPLQGLLQYFQLHPATETRISPGHVFNFTFSLEAEENLKFGCQKFWHQKEYWASLSSKNIMTYLVPKNKFALNGKRLCYFLYL